MIVTDKKTGKKFIKGEALIANNHEEYSRLMFVNVTSLLSAIQDSAEQAHNEAVENDEEFKFDTQPIADALIHIIKLMGSEYHVLVNSGKMEETEFCKEKEAGLDTMIEVYKKRMEEAKVDLIMEGLPVVEEGDKIEIDVEKVLAQEEEGEEE